MKNIIIKIKRQKNPVFLFFLVIYVPQQYLEIIQPYEGVFSFLMMIRHEIRKF